MKVVFYGSIDSSRSDFGQIELNLKTLVKLMVRHHAEFVVRCVNPASSPTTVPIDSIVIQALEESSEKGYKADVTVLFEPHDVKSVSWNVPVKSYTASTTSRIQFYSELLKLVDIVIGVGGQLGLIRLAISCEWTQHPFFVLPGSGGTTELLWSEMFVKSFQVKSFPDSIIDELRQMPYVNHVDKNYATKALKTISTFLESAVKYGTQNVNRSTDSIGLGDITLPTVIQAVRRLSLGVC